MAFVSAFEFRTLLPVKDSSPLSVNVGVLVKPLSSVDPPIFQEKPSPLPLLRSKNPELEF